MHSPVRIGEGREAGILDLGDGRVLRLRAIARLAEGIDAERASLLKLLQPSYARQLVEPIGLIP